jgi:hypothetical protein
MQDQYPHKSEVNPQWRNIEANPPPLGMKLLFKPDHGAAVIGIFYPESGWKWWSPLPGHTAEQKRLINARSINLTRS